MSGDCSVTKFLFGRKQIKRFQCSVEGAYLLIVSSHAAGIEDKKHM